MYLNELIGLVIFVIFWCLVYSFEIRYLIAFFRKKAFTPFKFMVIIHVLAICGIGFLIYGLFIEPYWIDVRHVRIETNKLKDTDLTIVQISDLHCDKKIRNEEALPEIINALNPDIIVFTGDSLNIRSASPVFKKTLSALKAQIGKFAVKGNIDVWYWKDLDLFNQTGFIELNGQALTLSKKGEKFNLSGLSIDYSSLDLAFLNSLSPDIYNVLLFHYPGINEELGDAPIDLFLSGHTHGGQVALPLYGAIVTLSKYGKKYEAGRYNVGQGTLYVNRGIGMEGGFAPRMRIFSRPEITVFHIKPRGDSS